MFSIHKMANKQNWLNDYKKIKIMRKGKNAPVDTMGAHALADENSSPKVYRFQCFVAALLSSRTRDEKTYLAMNNLKKHGLEVDNILNTAYRDYLNRQRYFADDLGRNFRIQLKLNY